MVSEDVIVKNEFLNDGGAIHIYYSEKYKEFVAFGFSAFQAMKMLKAKEIELRQIYSTEFQMPMVVISRGQMDSIIEDGVMRQGSVEGQYYLVQCFISLNETAYDEWAEFLRR